MHTKRTLAHVAQVEAFWLSEGPGKLFIVARGKKPTQFHGVDIAPVGVDALSFAVVLNHEIDYEVGKEEDYVYSEAFPIPRQVNEITVLFKNDNGKDDLMLVPVVNFEPNSLRSLKLSGVNTPANLPAFGPGLDAGAWQQNQGQRGMGPTPFSSKYGADIKFGSVVYAGCDIMLKGPIYHFYGEGAGGPGAGGYSGEIFLVPSIDLNIFIKTAATFAFAPIAFYGTGAFYDANGTYLAQFHGGGWGVGGAVYTGKWT